MEIGEYLTKQRSVQAVQITEENITEVAGWCGAPIVGDGPSRFLRVNAHRPQNKRQTEGHLGDWIVKQGPNFKVFLDQPFRFGFEPKLKGVHIENTPPVTALEAKYAPGAVVEKSPIFEEVLRANSSLVGLPKEPVKMPPPEDIMNDDPQAGMMNVPGQYRQMLAKSEFFKDAPPIQHDPDVD